MDEHEDIIIYPESDCLICGTPFAFEWSDYHGEGLCLSCGTPYQLYIYGPGDGRIQDSLPMLKLRSDFIEPMRAYWNETRRNMALGTYLGRHPRIDDRRAFDDWFRQSQWAHLLETAGE